MRKDLTDKIQVRVLNLLDKWQEEAEIVKDDIESYVTGFNIRKIKIAEDVSKMKLTFRQIEGIIKELR